MGPFENGGRRNMAAQFNIGHLKELVNLTACLLEQDDKSIRGCLEQNSTYSELGLRTISDFNEERYYQRLVLKALLPSFPFRVRLEYSYPRRRYDIALLDGSNRKPVALGQMKVWMRNNNQQEVDQTRKEIKNLSEQDCASFMLVFTKYLSENVTGTPDWLKDTLDSLQDGNPPLGEVYSRNFSTVIMVNHPKIFPNHFENGQFDVIAIPVKT
jgi:hypothetical protein